VGRGVLRVVEFDDGLLILVLDGDSEVGDARARVDSLGEQIPGTLSEQMVGDRLIVSGSVAGSGCSYR
jgi:hypothetical protein